MFSDKTANLLESFHYFSNQQLKSIAATNAIVLSVNY